MRRLRWAILIFLVYIFSPHEAKTRAVEAIRALLNNILMSCAFTETDGKNYQTQGDIIYLLRRLLWTYLSTQWKKSCLKHLKHLPFSYFSLLVVLARNWNFSIVFFMSAFSAFLIALFILKGNHCLLLASNLPIKSKLLSSVRMVPYGILCHEVQPDQKF